MFYSRLSFLESNKEGLDFKQNLKFQANLKFDQIRDSIRGTNFEKLVSDAYFAVDTSQPGLFHQRDDKSQDSVSTFLYRVSENNRYPSYIKIKIIIEVLVKQRQRESQRSQLHRWRENHRDPNKTEVDRIMEILVRKVQ